MVKPPWTPERVVTTDIARDLIRHRFPELEPFEVQPFESGWDNAAFLVNQKFIFRFPQREIGVAGLGREIATLAKLGGHLPLPIPNPQYVEAGDPPHIWPFYGYRILEGTSACRRPLTREERRGSAQDLGNFLRILHGLPVEEYSFLPGDHLGRSDLPKRISMTKELLNEFESSSKGFAMAIIERTEGLQLPQKTCVVHGDLYLRHLLFNGKKQLSGILDWGDMHLGNPAIDLSIAHSFLPPESHETFLDAYGAVEPSTWQGAQLLGLFFSLTIADYGKKTEDVGLSDAANTGIRYLSESRVTPRPD